MTRLTILVIVFALSVASPALAEGDWQNELTARSGKLIDIDRQHNDEYLTIPVLSYKDRLSLETGLLANFIEDGEIREFTPEAFVVGVTYELGDLKTALDSTFGRAWDWTKYVSFSVGPAWWYEFESETNGWAILASFLDVAPDEE